MVINNSRFSLLFLLLSIFFFFGLACKDTPKNENESLALQDKLSENTSNQGLQSSRIALRTGVELLFEQGLTKLSEKSIGVVANHTSLLKDGMHIVDRFLSEGIRVKKVFAPEHGFRGTASAGEAVESGKDKRTGLPIISLYGKNRKPNKDQIAGLDLIIFDIQDVGSRHYTYIGTMSYVMEACAEQGIPFMVLDRPNPNGWYVDGPVLEAGNNSFIGMHEVPIVHGMTIGEYAQMVNAEAWLKGGVQVELEVIPCTGYRHKMRWEDTGLEWVPPSPNLATSYSAYLYPAICWLEPTPVSLGRGTHDAFSILGAPWYKPTSTSFMGLEAEEYTFTPVSLPGKSTYPKFQDKSCEGLKFTNRVASKDLFLAGLLIFEELYQQAPNKESFFHKRFYKWPGNSSLQKQIESGLGVEEIYQSWQPKVQAFKQIRNKYLLYP